MGFMVSRVSEAGRRCEFMGDFREGGPNGGGVFEEMVQTPLGNCSTNTHAD
jgi:hypothetical protein